MAILKLASTKITPELLERLNRYTESTGLTQSAAIRQAIELFLDSVESTKSTELTNGEGSFRPSQLVARVDAVDDRLTDFEARLTAIESRSVMTTVKPIAVVGESKPVPPPPPNGKPLADGYQWLITNEAYERARKRGCEHPTKTAFSKFAKAHPDRLDVLGLRYLGANKPGDQRTASYEDLRFEG